MTDLADYVRFCDDAGQQAIGTTHDDEIDMEVAQESCRVDEGSVVSNGDEPLGRSG
jgi:energy-coupling factor transporter ATP-binding protein EcfA2